MSAIDQKGQKEQTNLPTKTEFLFNGLSAPSTQESSQECGICWEVPLQKDPPRPSVKLSCTGSHVFCISYITASLEASPLCPLCRVALYKREHSEDYDSDSDYDSEAEVDFPESWATGTEPIPRFDDDEAWVEYPELRRCIEYFQRWSKILDALHAGNIKFNHYSLAKIEPAELTSAFTGALFAKASELQDDTVEHHRCMIAWGNALFEARETLILIKGRILPADELERLLVARLCLVPYWKSRAWEVIPTSWSAEQLRFEDDLSEAVDYVVDMAKLAYVKSDYEDGNDVTGYTSNDTEHIMAHYGYGSTQYQEVLKEVSQRAVEEHAVEQHGQDLPLLEAMAAVWKELADEFLEGEL